MLNLYKVASEIVSNTVATQGMIATKTPSIRGMRTIKKESLRLVETFISKADDLKLMATNFIPPLFAAVLADYKRSIPQARDAEVLSLCAAVVNRLEVCLF